MPQLDVAMDRGGLEVLTLAECLALLTSVEVGRIAFVEGGDPLVLPVNHLVDGHCVVFRTTYGSKLDAAWREKPAAFEADQFDPATRTGWSVLLRGEAQEVLDPGEIAELDARGLEPWTDLGDRNRWVRVVPSEITGRRIVRF